MGVHNTVEEIHNIIDVHWLFKKEAFEIIKNRLEMTQNALLKLEIVPNTDDNINHVVKIVTGRGGHSKRGIGTLKIAVEKWLVHQGSDFHGNPAQGFFLVRLRNDQRLFN